MFIIYLFGKDLYPANETANGSQMGVSTIIVQVIKRKTKNTEGSNRISKKTIKKRPSKRLLSLLVMFLVSLVTVGSMGIGMTNFLYI